MKILWAKSGDLLPLDAGGKIRSFSIARELARRHEVDLFIFYPTTTPDPHINLRDPFGRVECMPLRLHERAGFRDMLAYSANALTTQPYKTRKVSPPKVLRRRRRFLEGGKYDALLCDFLLPAPVV